MHEDSGDGEREALKAQNAADALFAGKGDDAAMPSTEITGEEFIQNSSILDLLILAGVASSKGEGRRLIAQGGLYLNNERISDIDYTVRQEDFKDGSLVIRKGKKTYHKVILK